jgi:phosphoribosylformylglycinamidine (FGAM) synthase-like amidotransferase family enzyme
MAHFVPRIVAIRIEDRQDSFYTMVNSREAEVVVATYSGRKYLKTDADGYAPNNLLAQKECSNCNVIS